MSSGLGFAYRVMGVREKFEGQGVSGLEQGVAYRSPRFLTAI